MAPEQVRGAAAIRAIFSHWCGALCFLLGQRAFHRDTPAETMTAVLKEGPAGTNRLISFETQWTGFCR
jgi:hypothetical protein